MERRKKRKERVGGRCRAQTCLINWQRDLRGEVSCCAHRRGGEERVGKKGTENHA
jgi:hypothetical protein